MTTPRYSDQYKNIRTGFYHNVWNIVNIHSVLLQLVSNLIYTLFWAIIISKKNYLPILFAIVHVKNSEPVTPKFSGLDFSPTRTGISPRLADLQSLTWEIGDTRQWTGEQWTREQWPGEGGLTRAGSCRSPPRWPPCPGPRAGQTPARTIPGNPHLQTRRQESKHDWADIGNLADRNNDTETWIRGFNAFAGG